MKTTNGLSLCALAVLAACSSIPTEDGPALLISPVQRVEHSALSADAWYQTGRYHQGQSRYDEAAAAYESTLRANPDHAEAHNALGVVYASQGRYGLAEQHFQSAMALSGGAAHVYNNLGYAYLLQGRNAEALLALERARELQPDNPHVLANLATVAQRVGELALSVQDTLRGRSELASPSPAVTAPAAPASQSAAVVTISPRLELANGNGVRGMARQAAEVLREHGIPVARLTNQKPYRQAFTEVQYLKGLESEAVRIGALLPPGTSFVAKASLQRNAQIRVVLGRDFVDELARRDSYSEPLLLARNELAAR